MSFVYILKLFNKGYYVGSCRDLLKRLQNHKMGQVYSTKNKLPITLIFAKEFKTYSEARKEEIRIKAWKKRKSIENLCIFDKKNKAKQFAPIV